MFSRLYKSSRLRSDLAKIALCLIPFYAWAAGDSQFERGIAAYQAGDLKLAVRLWQPLAERGDPEAQFGIATLYHAGKGLPLDRTESSYWFLLSAEQGFAAAQYNLGNAYKRGEGLRPNAKMAIYWWEKAAAQGFAAAQFNLATAYREGAGVNKDPAHAMTLYRQSAQNGYPPAIDLLKQRQPEDASGEDTSCRTYLAQRKTRGYTIQIVSSTKRLDVLENAQQHGLMDEALICSYQHQGRNRYALLYGNYPSSASAEAALEKLPREICNNKPWIRSIRALKQ